jgi:glutamate synthase (NADPH) small chain
MAEKLLKFVTLAKTPPDKRPAAERSHDFAEIHAEYKAIQAAAQSSRCSQCGVPFCQVHCPLSNNIPDWLKLTAEGRLEEAYELSSATNTFPEICGRICPQDRLCEGNCVIERAGHGTVTIGAIEKFITEEAFAKGWVRPIRPAREKPQNVGIIGAGPAGLAAAERLRRLGYGVTIYDRHDRVGGLLVYGIPNFKLDKSVVVRREDLLRKSGIEFKLEFALGRDASLADLRRRHDAILIATGVYQARQLTRPGIAAKGVHQALDFLIEANRRGLDKPIAAEPDAAMDCVRTAIRQGAKSVACLYRRDRINMPGSQREVAHAEEEGVEFVWQAGPSALIDDAKGHVRAVRAQRIHLGPIDAGGRQAPRAIDGSDFELAADFVILALGFDPEDLPGLAGEPELAVNSNGTIKIDWRNLMTSIPGVFAAGDIVRGASLVVWAIRDGQDAAKSIDAYFRAAETAPLKAAE